ncbi:zinc finger BED domain-containing protein 5-like [Apostichopus japonicus]|uniref:zinc finger BED domain-containing protein 5-like n=1 Tax=Stichopus japonicus TaxID=307972 RepID=UPI003AB2858D
MKEVVRILIGPDQAKLLIAEIKSSPFYSIASDESTDVASLSQLMVWVRYMVEDGFKDEPLFCSPLELTTTGADVFLAIQTYINENGIGFDKLVGSCTDGAPAMLGSRSGFQTRLKEVAPQVKTTHCMLHRQALASKTLPQQMKNVLDQAVKIVNAVKKSPLNTRLFTKLCEEMDAQFSNLLYHTEVRWLSRGKVLMRLFDLRN